MALAAVVLTACKASDLNVVNPNVASVTGAGADPTAFQLLATGILSDYRGTATAMNSGAGILGRESYVFTPQEGRNTTHFLLGIVAGGKQELDPTGFATGPWGGQYNSLRDLYNFKIAINGNAALSTAQKAASLGFAQTMEAANLLVVVMAHDSLGGVTQVLDDATQLAPFVTRDSMYNYIINTFDAAVTNLQAGGTAFPFTLHTGFNGFNTPATFAQFARALQARAAANYATLGGGAAAWAKTLTALQGSFLVPTATTRAQFDAGPQTIYSTATGDATNPFNVATNTTLYAHASFLTDVQNKLDGTPDNRYLAKIRTGLPSRQGPVTTDGPTSGSSTLGFNMWAASTTPISIIRNEELILLRAEAELGTGATAAAIADINQVRVNSGGLPPTTVTPASTTDQILTAILYEKRYSTMFEGLRWADMRRYNKLNLLPLDVASGPNKNFVAKVFPITQTECLVRAGKTGPGMQGPGTQNNCIP